MSPPAQPSYDLATVKALIQDPKSYVLAQSALDGAWKLEMDRYDIVECVLQLQPSDFFKTMPAERMPSLMQDVYKPTYLGVKMYVKVQITAGAMLVVISFKEA